MADAVVARCIEHIADARPPAGCGDVDAAALCRAMREPAPEQGVALEPLLDALFRDWIPRSFTAPSARLPRVHSGRRPLSGGARRLHRQHDQPLHRRLAGGAGAGAARGQRARLAARLDGVSAEARAACSPPAARWRPSTPSCARANGTSAPRSGRGVLYTSDQAHHSVLKSAKLAGVMPDRVRAIASDDRFRLRIDALREAIAARSPRRPDAVRRRVERRDDQHRRRRSARRDRRRLRRAKGCGTTSTAPTARSSICATSCATRCAACRAPIR